MWKCGSNAVVLVQSYNEKTPDTHYHVTRLGTDNPDCSCPAKKYNPDKECKHIKQARQEACLWIEGKAKQESTVLGKCPACGGVSYFQSDEGIKA